MWNVIFGRGVVVGGGLGFGVVRLEHASVTLHNEIKIKIEVIVRDSV